MTIKKSKNNMNLEINCYALSNSPCVFVYFKMGVGGIVMSMLLYDKF